MEKCPICRKKDANKKNVHLIPWFLIKNCITLDGTGERNTELSFRIGTHTFPSIYAGRSILPEHIAEYSDLDISQNEEQNPYSRDYLICFDCEDKLSRLEAIFAFEFSDKKLKTQLNFSSFYEHSIFINSRYNSSLYQLLIQSIFYRCSKGQFNGFNLNPVCEKKIEENLRKVFLDINFNKIKPTEQLEIINPFPIITCSFFVPENEDSTNQLICVNRYRFPYFIMAGKWMFQLFEAEKHLRSTVESLYGLHTKLKTLETYKITKDTSHVIILEQTVSKTILNNLLQFLVEKRIIGLKKNIKALYFQKFKFKPDNNVVQYILNRYFFHFQQGETELKSMINAFNDYINPTFQN